MNCKNCQGELTSKYCPNCGQSANLKRIDGNYIMHEIKHVLHFEKGILFTIRELLIRPGENVRHFITENRNRLVKPIIFIIVTSLLYTLTIHFFHIEDGYIKFTVSGTEKSAAVDIVNWIQAHYGYSNIVIGIFITLWLKIFFKKFDYNFYEILILLCFVIGMEMLLLTVFATFQGLTHLNVMKIGSITGVIYFLWAIGQFFDKKQKITYVKGLASYMLGMITFIISAILLGALIDWIVKQ